MTQRFDVTGMTCGACAAHVEKVVKKLDGVTSVSVNLLMNSMTVDFLAEKTTPDNIVSAVQKAGYGARLKGDKGNQSYQGGDSEDIKDNTIECKDICLIDKANNENSKSNNETQIKKQQKALFNRLIISLCLLVPLMYVSMGHMIGLPLPAFLHGKHGHMTFALVQFFLSLPVIILNRSFFINGFKAALRRAPNMDTLVATGAGAAFLYGIVALFIIGDALGRGDHKLAEKFAMDLYFESAVTILTFINAGKYLEMRSKGRTADAIYKLMDLSPKTATVIRNETEVTLPASQLIKGDIIVIRSGQSIPADGVIIEGSGTLDESAVTGESLPVDKKTGDSVTAGTINKSGYFKFRAEKVGEDTTLSQIIRLVNDANTTKAPVQKLADKVSGIFVPFVFTAALLAGIAWLIAGQPVGFALRISIAVLVISCPCALGLATPAAIMTGTGKGAQMGILFKTAESLENLHKTKVIILDKTGTVTGGKPQLTDIVTAEGFSTESVLRLAASAESLSEHPLAYAVVKKAEELNLGLLLATDFYSGAGLGIQAIIENKVVRIGNFRLAKHMLQAMDNTDTFWVSADNQQYEDLSLADKNYNGLQLSGENQKLFDKAQQLAGLGKTVLFVFEDLACIGVLAISDVIKPESRQAVQDFYSMGIEVVMLTGDNALAAAAVGAEAGIQKIESELKPADKEQQVRAYQQGGQKVAMIGDGINDAPALSRADTGIAIGAGTDIAIDSADVVLMGSRLDHAVTAIRLSKATLRNIKQNLFWAFFYNAVCIPLAAGVFYPVSGLTLNPMWAAAAMSLSSVFVVLNALRLKFFKDKRTDGQNTSNTININNNKEEVMKKIILIEGMMCGHCSGRVADALNSLDGVTATVSHAEGRAEVSGANLNNTLLKSAVEKAGYKVISIEDK